MPPSCARDFQRAASQRLHAAEVLFAERLNLDARYVGGYVVECSLKALILELTAPTNHPAAFSRITSGAAMHRPLVLLGELRPLGAVLPIDLARRFRRFDWSTDLRYAVGRRDTGETRAFLNTARAIFQWVEDQLP